ncbi:non-reducing end alpha-L-arabinofuranosidase family hydrolase [Glycomyces rhizosphaerae]|uniref:non-reducing end alpha-L-arabinofuranosidase n=1 Tax=Glycomyces rhizosphaerae TaxID=2054422 RepID=A0ABV7PQT9_9ACTN
MQRTLRNRMLGGLAALAVATTLASSALIANAQTTDGGTSDDGSADEVGAQALPTSYQWESTGPLIGPKSDATHNVVSAKDPTVVRYNNEWLVYNTVANTPEGHWSLAFTHFSDWSQAADAPVTFLDTNPNIGSRYAAAPQLFYFAPDDEWYLVYQTGPPSYSTSKNPADPMSWSAPKNFIDETPPIVEENSGGWLDFWNICDDSMCYLFAADDDGRVYRSETTIGEFPNGFRNTQIVLQDTRDLLFEGGAVYQVDNSDQYLLIWEAMGSNGRYYRSYLADGLTGQWQLQAGDQSAPFAGIANVTFPDGQWTADISHGELIRSGNDQTMNIDTGNLQMLYQGRDPSTDGMEYSQLPYRLALLTLTGGASC